MIENSNPFSKRQELELLRSQLELDRASFLSHWRELGDHILPRRPRFVVTDANRGERKNLKIIDSTPTLSARILRAGLMSGVTSPARPWFKLEIEGVESSEQGPVRYWLDEVSELIRSAFNKSGLYRALPVVYGDLGAFGTSALFIEEDVESFMRFIPVPIGSYFLGSDSRGRVVVFIRDFRMTVRQVVGEYGRQENGSIEWKNISHLVKSLWDAKNTEQWIDICHVVRPNPDYDPDKFGSKKFESVYYERGTSSTGSAHAMVGDTGLILRTRGYDHFPVLCPRWEITGEDVYGTDCPGMTALGDIKQLQLQEKRIAQAIEKQINPPMVAPTSMRNQKASILPGDITYIDEMQNGGGFRTAHEVNLRIDTVEAKQMQIRERINKCFYADLFLMISELDRRQITATEIAERKEEKLLALGPVLEQLNQDLLDPLIDLAFEFLNRQGYLPAPPPEIQGADIKVEYISVMAQAQKLIGLQAIDRVIGMAGNLAQANPEVLDKIDSDQIIDSVADLVAVPRGIVRSDAQVSEIRQARANAQAAQQQAAMAQQAAQTAQSLSQTQTEGKNALTDLMNMSQAGALI